MTSFHELDAKAKRRCLRLHREVLARGCVYVRGEASFRNAERLHKARLVTAVVSKVNLFGDGKRPFRELALFPSEAEARRRYSRVMPR